ncbi:MAG TPA: cation-translocating P-type ATPase [Gemmatimonadales bacterium]|nr:cation-translocating P-type ATPase [Gemmatimonadales bacterium]
MTSPTGRRRLPAASGSGPSPPGGSAPPEGQPWHTLPVAAVAELLSTSVATGLGPDDAATRLRAYGPNAITQRRRRSASRILVGQFSDFMVLVLAAAAVLAGVIGEPQDTVAIGAILVLNAILGFMQEYRAERALEALRTLAVASVRVRRGGVTTVVPGIEVVPGDLVLLETGNLVPADLRLTEVAHLRAEEAALTGESQVVDKLTVTLPDPHAVVGDRRNMAYKGTAVAHGRGAGLVVATGMATELGRIAGLLAQETGVKTPLQLRLTRLGQRLAGAALAICALVLALGLVRGEAPLPMLLTAISLAVAAIPEALPAVVTVALALGARRMIRERALVRHLPAVETLGSVTFICVDKTGTLTQNRMRVESYWVGRSAAEPPPPSVRTGPWPRLLEALALNNNVHLTPGGAPLGDPTEVALVQAAAGAGCDPAMAARRYPRVGELPFTPERACMTTLHRFGAETVAFTKGSPERVLSKCVNRLGTDAPGPMDVATVLRRADEMAEAGLRVIAVAFRQFPEPPDPVSPATVEAGQTLLGLVGLLDPPRPEAAAAVATCRSAGITVVMITGDHAVTARNIAARLGILDQDGEVLAGAQLGSLDPEELVRRAGLVRVYARVAPEQKIAIIRALQSQGECVAMTGDGVNDAPALQRAEIGIAMGLSGTDVAREVADVVLLDDNFATIVSAVRAGRRIYDNIRKFVRYAVTCNAAEVWTLLFAPLIALPIPLLPIHLLWINLVTDGLPGIALAAEPAERDVMRRPPRRPDENIFARGLWQHVIWVGLLMAGVTLATQAWAYHAGSAHWQTMAFTVLALSQMGHVLAIRSERESLFGMGITSNPWLLAAVALTVVLQLGTIYLPGASRVFKTQPLGVRELLICLAVSTVVFLAVEAEKWLIRRRVLYRAPAVTGPPSRPEPV